MAVAGLEEGHRLPACLRPGPRRASPCPGADALITFPSPEEESRLSPLSLLVSFPDSDTWGCPALAETGLLQALPLLPPQIRAPTTALIIGPLCEMLGCFPTLAETPGGHSSEVTRLQESLDLFSELLAGGRLAPGKRNVPLLSCSSPSCSQPFRRCGCCRDHRQGSFRPSQHPARPLGPFTDLGLGRLVGWGQCVRQSSRGLEKAPKAFCARVSSLSPLFLKVLNPHTH